MTKQEALEAILSAEPPRENETIWDTFFKFRRLFLAIQAYFQEGAKTE